MPRTSRCCAPLRRAPSPIIARATADAAAGGFAVAKNRQWLLAQRPPGDFDESAFKFTEAPVPTPKDGEVLVHNIWLSLDPYMRGRMRDVKSYVPPVQLGAVMEGGTVGEVIESKNPAFKKGDIVEERLGWQDY